MGGAAAGAEIQHDIVIDEVGRLAAQGQVG
jgi:hypothetical protein